MSQFDTVIGSVYDTLKLNHVYSTTKSMFVVPIGVTKTREQTNMICAAKLLEPNTMKIHRICFSFYGKDADKLILHSSFQLQIGYKIYVDGLISMLQTTDFSNAPIVICDYCKSVFVLGSCPTCGARKFKVLEVESNKNKNNCIFYYDISQIPLQIQQSEFFKIDFTSHVYIEEGIVLCELRGEISRAIQ